MKLSNDIYIHFALEKEIIILKKHAETLHSILENVKFIVIRVFNKLKLNI